VNLSTSYLTEEIRVLSGAYSRALSGVPEAKDKVKAAYQLHKVLSNKPWVSGMPMKNSLQKLRQM
jgi:Predicted metalloendopeptidase